MVLTFKLRHNQEIYLFSLIHKVNAEQENNNGLSQVRLFLVALTDIAQLIVCHPTNPQFLILFLILPCSLSIGLSDRIQPLAHDVYFSKTLLRPCLDPLAKV